jgi:hypothetical protein
MNELKIKPAPGAYRLIADVHNPKPDRRSKDWAKQPTIEAGLVLVVTQDKHGETAMAPVHGRYPSTLYSGYEECVPLMAALCACMEPVPETFDSYLRRTGHRNCVDDAIAHAIKHRKISLETVAMWIEDYMNDDSEA